MLEGDTLKTGPHDFLVLGLIIIHKLSAHIICFLIFNQNVKTETTFHLTSLSTRFYPSPPNIWKFWYKILTFLQSNQLLIESGLRYVHITIVKWVAIHDDFIDDVWTTCLHFQLSWLENDAGYQLYFKEGHDDLYSRVLSCICLLFMFVWEDLRAQSGF